MRTVQYLDLAKKRLGVESDYALAKHLELTPQAVSKLRMRPLVMSNTTAAKVAEILGVDPLKVIADCELERGSNDAFWTRIAKRVAVFALAAIGAALAVYLGPEAGGFDNTGIASMALSLFVTGPQYTLCAFAAALVALWATWRWWPWFWVQRPA